MSRGEDGVDDDTRRALEATVTSAATARGPLVPVSKFPTVSPGVYEVGAELGRGGMGRVVSAFDKRLDRQVAIKELLVRSEHLELRFAREARITAKLQHPAIIPVHDVGQWPDGSRFYTMKLIAGQPLDQLISAATPLVDRLALVPKIATVCEAIAYAHEQRVIHRDLKPSNILIGKFGETLVVDWGIAKELESTVPDEVDAAAKTMRLGGDATAIGSVLGTPAYMPPEQALGEPVDERADVYSLGAVLYSLLTRRLPFSASSADGVLAEVVAGPPLSVTTHEPQAPPELVAIVEKAMHRDRDARYPHAGALVIDLQRYLTGQLVGSHRYTFGQLARRWANKHRGAIAVSIAAFAMLAVVGTFAIWRIVNARNSADQSARQAAAERDISADTAAKLLLESARRELVEGNTDQATAYLAAGYRGDESLPMQLVAGLISEQAMLNGTHVEARESPHALRFSQGDVLAITQDRITVFDALTGAALPAARSGLRRLEASSRDGRYLLTREPDARTLQLWDGDVATAVPLTLTASSTTAVANDGSRVIVADGTSLTVWSREAGTSTSPIAVPPACLARWKPHILVCDATCSSIVIGTTECAAVVTTRGAAAQWLEADGAPLEAARISRDGSRVLITSTHLNPGVMFVGAPGALKRVELPALVEKSHIHGVSTDGGRLVASRSTAVMLIDTEGITETVDVGEMIASADLDETGSLIVASTETGNTVFLRPHPLRIVERLRATGTVVVGSDGRAALVGDRVLRPRAPAPAPGAGINGLLRFVTNDGVIAYIDLTRVHFIGDGLPANLLDISDDGTQLLTCATAQCDQLLVTDRVTGREIVRVPGRSPAFLARDTVVSSGAVGNIVTPINGSPPVEVPLCDAKAKLEWWMSPDHSQVFCACRDSTCPAGARAIRIELASPSLSAGPVPSAPDSRCGKARPRFGVMGSDHVQIYRCGGKDSHLLDARGNIVCDGWYVSHGDDGRCYAVHHGDAGRTGIGPTAIAVHDVAAGRGASRQIFGEFVELIEVRGPILYAAIAAHPGELAGIALYEAATGMLLGRIDLPELSVRGFGVSHDGRTVVASTALGERVTIRIPFEQRPREYVVPFLESRTRWRVVGSQLQRKPD